MLTCGIIAEYNPFHLGHLHQINTARQQTGATHIAAVMSGNFVQRGEPALCDKFARAEMAVRSGADLVVELPLPFAVAGAQVFAAGGVGLLNSLGADLISFGSECGDLPRIAAAAEAIDSTKVRASMEALLDKGLTFAAAREQAVAQHYGELSALLGSPNDTLAIEYVRALRLSGSKIAPHAVKRLGAAHDGQPEGQIASASHIREMLRSGDKHATDYMPAVAAEILRRQIDSGCFVSSGEKAELLTLHALRGMTAEQLAALPDVSEGLHNRIYQAVRTVTEPSALIDAVKTKRYTHARLRRICLAALLGITADMTAEPPPYIRVLAMNDRGAEILAGAKEHCPLPIITRSRDAHELSGRAKEMFETECRSTDIYGLLTDKIQPCDRDMVHGIIKI